MTAYDNLKIGDKVKIKHATSKWFSDGEIVEVSYIWSNRNQVVVQKLDHSWRWTTDIENLAVIVMTNKEAAEYNKNLIEYMKITDKESEYKFLEENYEALDMANKALEQESITWIVGKDNCQVAVRNMPTDKMQKICAIIEEEEQQPCEDCISREEALKVMCDSCPMYNCVTGCSSYRYIEKMPSVTPHKAESEEQESILVKIRAELIQSIQNGTLKIESGNEELFSIIDKYMAESKKI